MQPDDPHRESCSTQEEALCDAGELVQLFKRSPSHLIVLDCRTPSASEPVGSLSCWMTLLGVSTSTPNRAAHRINAAT